MAWLNDLRLKRLQSAVEHSRRQLQPYRRNYTELLREYVGSHHSDNGSKQKVPLNLTQLFISTLVRQLAARAPRALITTQYQELKPYARTFELAVNQAIDELKLQRTLRRWVQRTLFGGLGIVHVGREGVGGFRVGDEWWRRGKTFAEVISLDDWVHDMNAQSLSWEDLTFCGNLIRVPLDEARENPAYDKAKRGKLTATHKTNMNEDGEERAEAISQGEWGGMEEFEDHVELQQIYFPRLDMFAVWAPDQPQVGVLCERDGDGKDRRPYHFLFFDEVPDGTMPLSEGSLRRDLNDLVNRLFNKTARQAERQKVIGIYQGGDEEAVGRINDANDGETVKGDNGLPLQEVRLGGADPATLALVIQCRELYSYFGLSLDVLAGLSPQAPTARQDELLSQAASKAVQDMQEQMVTATKGLIEHIAWYEWHEPLGERIVFKAGDVPAYFSRERHQGDWLHYKFDIEPYSMQHTSPSQRLQTIVQFLQLIGPFAPMMQQQGMSFNFEGIVRTVARYTDMTELEDIITFVGPPTAPDEGGMSHERMMPMSTTRENVRINMPGTGMAAKDNAMMQMLQLAMRGQGGRMAG